MNAFRHFAAPVVALCLVGAGVVGCSSDPKVEQVPANARMEMQGDRQLAYTAQRNGEIYVYDFDDETLLYRGKVEKGQVVTVDPDEDKIMIDNKLALEKDIHAGNRHRIYFVPDRDEDRVIEERTTIREQSSAGDRIERRSDADSTTIRREETKRVETGGEPDVTVKKQTTITTN
ncbi:MAG TPA: hypothetical protein VGR35_16175 [Tepidisphaeraceae bacterium]|nr:hypothetical protein [Tepidisphaeraceae bacterium]